MIPPTVTDQVYLWEQERDRLSFTEGKHHHGLVMYNTCTLLGVLYNQFLTQNDFELVRQYAEVRNIIPFIGSIL